jgi:hypothetical protein
MIRDGSGKVTVHPLQGSRPVEGDLNAGSGWACGIVNRRMPSGGRVSRPFRYLPRRGIPIACGCGRAGSRRTSLGGPSRAAIPEHPRRLRTHLRWTRSLLRLALGRRPTTTAGTLRVPGLAGRLTVRRDRGGIPVVEAMTDADAWYGLGFCHAQDCGTQLDFFRRAAAGTLSELVGRHGLAADRVSRRIGFGSGPKSSSGSWPRTCGPPSRPMRSGCRPGSDTGSRRSRTSTPSGAANPGRRDPGTGSAGGVPTVAPGMPAPVGPGPAREVQFGDNVPAADAFLRPYREWGNGTPAVGRNRPVQSEADRFNSAERSPGVPWRSPALDPTDPGSSFRAREEAPDHGPDRDRPRPSPAPRFPAGATV